MYDICIIGGGASGMTAAISAKRFNRDTSVIILEKKDRLGKKILATGNGKCNLSNEKCSDYRSILSFFQEIGVITRMDDSGRFYPYTEDARDVAGALIRRLNTLGVDIDCDAEVAKVNKNDDGFLITYTTKGKKLTLTCKKLLIACGGKAGPEFGTTGDGYKFARSLGHSVTRLAPALTAVELYENMNSFAGIRVKAKVVLKYKGEEVFEEAGEVQFTKYGISGICVFNLSRFLVLPNGTKLEGGFDDYILSVDFLSSGGDVENFLRERSEMSFLNGSDILSSIVRKPIALDIYEKSKGDIKSMARLLHDYPLHPKGLKGWDFAQVTKGGIPLEEVNNETMESKILNNLYFAGEILNYDGPCGGFNLQNAWESGIKAGKGISR